MRDMEEVAPLSSSFFSCFFPPPPPRSVLPPLFLPPCLLFLLHLSLYFCPVLLFLFVTRPRSSYLPAFFSAPFLVSKAQFPSPSSQFCFLVPSSPPRPSSSRLTLLLVLFPFPVLALFPCPLNLLLYPRLLAKSSPPHFLPVSCPSIFSTLVLAFNSPLPPLPLLSSVSLSRHQTTREASCSVCD